MESPERYKNKFELLFEALVQPSYQINSYYADNLMQLLNEEGAKDLLAIPFLSDLLLAAFLKAEQCTLSVQAFLTRLTAVVASNELQFTKMCFLGGISMLQNVVDVGNPRLAPAVRVAFIELADNLTSHTSGLTWLLSSDVWKYIFNMCYQSQTVRVKRYCFKFLSNLIWRSSEMDDKNRCIPLLEYLLKPIFESPYQVAQEISMEDQESWTALLEPSVQVFYAVFLEKDKINRPSNVVRLLSEHFKIERYLVNIVSLTRIPNFCVQISMVSNMICFAKVLHKKWNNLTDQDCVEALILYISAANGLVMKGMTRAVLDYVTNCYTIFNKIAKDNIPGSFAVYGRTFSVQNQLVMLPLVPTLVYVHLQRHNSAMWAEFLDGFFALLSSETCEHTVRACYMFRDLLNQENEPKKILIESLKRLFIFKTNLSAWQAGVMFRSQFYLLNCYLGESLDADKNIIITVVPLTEEDLKILVLAVEVIQMLLKQYEVEWHEGFELTCLYSKITNILKANVMTLKFVVCSLDVIKLSMRKFLHPNLALLIESQDMSALEEITELVVVYLQDARWEVRDSASQLLLEILDIARRYTPMEQLILKNNLISSVAIAALNDTESYVRASSMKCLIATTKIRILWDTLLALNPELYRQLLDVSLNSREALVRMEAIAIWKDILEQGHRLPAGVSDKLYCVMMSASDDLHWEVQLAALCFWKKVIHNRLTHYGMLDGVFPPVTFSRELHKIIQLTDRTIQTFLVKILEELANVGCLKALCDTLLEDSHVQVLETSLKISRDFMNILSQYNVTQCPEAESASTDRQCPVLNQTEMWASPHLAGRTVPTSPDGVIDSILSTHDVDLLETHYESQVNLQTTLQPCLRRHYGSPNQFLHILSSTDFDEIVKSKKEWNAGIVNLHSLLDEMLDYNPVSSGVDEFGCC